mgnify:CR=1 FL=1|jgi:hypothetical protein
MIQLNAQEERQIKGGEAVTLAAVLALLVIGIVSVIVYKLFVCNEAKVTLPGGWTFTWE